jgi:hypothetical protein
MIYVELLASFFTIYTAYLLGKGKVTWGARTGVIGQIFWLVFIFGDERIHYGLIPADGVIFFLYLKSVISNFSIDHQEH